MLRRLFLPAGFGWRFQFTLGPEICFQYPTVQMRRNIWVRGNQPLYHRYSRAGVSNSTYLGATGGRVWVIKYSTQKRSTTYPI